MASNDLSETNLTSGRWQEQNHCNKPTTKRSCKLAQERGSPRASFVLLTYNQEQFVRRAVHGALAQTTQPLEIIISDDCSTDATFDIIRQEVANYAGPHDIVVNRNEKNLGITQHINKVVELAQCEIIIYACGDDISEPDRATRLLRAIGSERSLLVHSRVELIDEQDNSLQAKPKNPLFFHTTQVGDALKSFALYNGATAAWRRDLFAKYGPLPQTDAFEDLITGFRAALEGRISFIDEELVQYRYGSGVSSDSIRPSNRSAIEQYCLDASQRKCDVLKQRIRDARKFGHDDGSQTISSLQHILQHYQIRRDVCRFGVFRASLNHRRTPGKVLRAILSKLNIHRRIYRRRTNPTS